MAAGPVPAQMWQQWHHTMKSLGTGAVRYDVSGSVRSRGRAMHGPPQSRSELRAANDLEGLLAFGFEPVDFNVRLRRQEAWLPGFPTYHATGPVR